MTTWRKNEPNAIKREAVLQIWNSTTGKPADRGTDFIALGIVFVRGANTPNLDLPLGTMTNERRAFTAAELAARTFTFTADAATDQLHKVAHLLETGDGPFTPTNAGGALPGGLVLVPPLYYVIKVDADNFKVATSLANAYAAVAVDITSNGSGVNTWTPAAGCTRGMDGRFVYRATQPETNHDGDEMEVVVDSGSAGDYALVNSAGGAATVAMQTGDGWTDIFEGGLTRDQGLRAALLLALGRIVRAGTSFTVYHLDGVTPAFHGTVATATGRDPVVIDAI